MGNRTIPAQVEYFCDLCNAELNKSNYDDFVVNIHETLHDFNGSACGVNSDKYELCHSCASKFKGIFKELEK